MRVGQKNPITRRWARRGTRPAAPKDQRTTSAYIFGAICPKEGKGAAIVMPRCLTEAMTLHLAELSRAVAPNAHAVVILDQAGWHRSRALVVPHNITLMPLPACAPELNPVENIWQFMQDKLALEPHLPLLRRHPRPLLRRLEQTPRPADKDHLHRSPQLGAWVLINKSWYKLDFGGSLDLPRARRGEPHGRRTQAKARAGTAKGREAELQARGAPRDRPRDRASARGRAGRRAPHGAGGLRRARRRGSARRPRPEERRRGRRGGASTRPRPGWVDADGPPGGVGAVSRQTKARTPATKS